MSVRDEVALPPQELIIRVGDDPGDTVAEYHAIGGRHRKLLESYLPPDWVWSDKTYLDWGAGAGRLVRHFLAEAETNRIIGADIHEPSVQWIRDHLAPVESVLVHEEPGIDLVANSVDFVSGFSVMTHITDHWAGWLLEIRRVLRPGGLALLSFCGEAMIPVLLDGTEQIDDLGMLVVKYGNPWRFGGPTVLHSPWWIRAHWGRAFDIVRIDSAALQGVKTGHDLALLQKPFSAPASIEDLEAVDPSDARETRGTMTAFRHARAELCEVRGDYEVAREEAYHQRLLAEDRALKLHVVQTSHSWKITRPLRALTSRFNPTDGWKLD
jgi:SAM-dependent methyltransferase